MTLEDKALAIRNSLVFIKVAIQQAESRQLTAFEVERCLRDIKAILELLKQ